MAEYKTPHVHEALLAILNSLSVEKGGMLPGNMGGKPYITAVDAAAEVKRKFVEHGLTFLPAERLVNVKYITHNNRLHVATVIEGTYVFTSTKDGSEASVTGIGDGLAMGTAVSSNIASTNALKNALLRTFLITEQSVEDAAKNGTESDERAPGQSTPSRAERAVATAKKPSGNEETKALNEARAAVKTAWAETRGEDEDFDERGYFAFGQKLSEAGKLSKGWSDSKAQLDKLEKVIRSGEVID